MKITAKVDDGQLEWQPSKSLVRNLRGATGLSESALKKVLQGTFSPSMCQTELFFEGVAQCGDPEVIKEALAAYSKAVTDIGAVVRSKLK